MSRCGGRYKCGCGQAWCWWSAFGLLWWLIAYEMTEQSGYRRPNTFCEYMDSLEEDAHV